MSNALEGLKPELLWKYFGEISRIPRGSKNEEAICRYLMDTAKALGLEAVQDAIGNVVVRKPATPGLENAKRICLQGHVDMVCEKNQDTVHDFLKDPIELVRKGNFLMANGTTLGADNGIAVATSLAIMASTDLVHGPLEFLFTVDEETGLTGASNLSPDILQSRVLLNLDSEEEGALYVGCAGGKNTNASWKVDLEEPDDDLIAHQLTVRGLKGGHSGLEIDKGRGNSLKIINRVIMRLAELGVRLATLSGGNKHNAIPREADALVFIPKKRLDAARDVIDEMNTTIRAEFSSVDPDLVIALSGAIEVKKARVMKKSSQRRLMYALSAVPHGVIRMSADIPGLVETSTNLAIVTTEKKLVSVVTSQRSSVASEIVEIAQTVAAVFLLAEADVEQGAGYPGWKPNLASPVLGLALSSYKELYGKDPHVKAIHAGLECGLIGEKYPAMDMVSCGPTLEGVHSPDEKIFLDTVEKYWTLVITMLAKADTL